MSVTLCPCLPAQLKLVDIANHLERIASFSLPATARDDDSDGGSSVASRGGSATSDSSQDLSQDLSEVSFHSDKIEDEESSIPVESSLIEALQDLNTLSAPGLLSAETLGNVPDSTQTRLDYLMAGNIDQPEQDEDIDQPEQEHEEGTFEASLQATESFRTYLLSFPGSRNVQFYRRFKGWRGRVTFDVEASALSALETFDTSRFPHIEMRHRSKCDASSLQFRDRTPQSSRLVTPVRRRSTLEQEDEASLSSGSVSYDDEPSEDSKPPILPLTEIDTLRSLYMSRKLVQRDQSYAPNVTYNQIISFCRYDITRLQVDCIVNSAHRAMRITRTSDSLNRYIHKAAGRGLDEECKKLGSVKTGAVRLTQGYKLPSQFVIHAARPQHTGARVGVGAFNMLTECYRSSLKLAMKHGIKSIAFPCLGAGGCGFPSRVAARIALQEVREFLDVHQDHSFFERIIFCVYSGADEQAYMDFLPVFFPPTHSDLEKRVSVEQSRDPADIFSQLRDVETQGT